MVSAAVYVRISQDRSGLQAGVRRQQEDCLDLAARLGFEDPVVLADNDISAYDGGGRPGYELLVEQIRSGVSVVVVWHVDRLYRQPRELEDLIGLVERHPVRIEAVRGGGLDLNTVEGRLMARQFVAVAAYESGHKSDRITRAARRKAEQGAWHGPARYGYGPGGVLIPEEAAVVRQMADRFLAGESLRSIARWLNMSGIAPGRAGTGTAGIWYPYTVRSVLASARISGQRAYAPDRRSDPVEGREILGPGDWEAIITPEQTARIRAILADPSRRPACPAVLSLLGGIARCGKCGAGLTIVKHTSTRGGTATLRYACRADPSRPQRGGVTINAAHLDEHVAARVLHRLAAPRTSARAGSTTAVLAQISTLNARLTEIDRDRQDRLISVREHTVARTAAREALAAAGRALATVTGEAVALHAAPIGDRPGLEVWWESLDVPGRRAVIKALTSRVTVGPGQRGRGVASRRVRITYSR